MKIKNLCLLFFIITTLISCVFNDKTDIEADFIIAFGSCNRETVNHNLWESILKENPNVWIWGGDNIYADTKTSLMSSTR